MAARCVPFTAARIKSEAEERRERQSIRCFLLALFFFFLAAEELLGCSGAFRWRLFSTPSDWAPILQTALLSAPFSFSLLSSPMFKMAVHLSVQLANWALSVAGPLVNSNHWNPFSLHPLHFNTSNSIIEFLSESVLSSSLRQLSEADRGQKKTKNKTN